MAAAALQFTIVIPVFKGGDKITRTLDSLLAQSALAEGTARLSVLVMDGASTDDTYARAAAFDDPRIEIFSEPDSGMYDALAKGLTRADGDVTGYLAAGEVLDPHAFAVVAEVLTRYPEIKWVTGQEVTRNAAGQIINCRLPHPFLRRFFDCGMYGTRLTVLQQESTLWRSALTARVDLDRLASCRLAGDYLLWRSFARAHDLYVIDTHIGSFTVEPGQLSQQEPGAYRRELRALRRRPMLWERLAALVYRQYLKRARPGRRNRRLIRFDYGTGEWRVTRR